MLHLDPVRRVRKLPSASARVSTAMLVLRPILFRMRAARSVRCTSVALDRSSSSAGLLAFVFGRF
ncbi:uncharacterized protein B0H18DRAFT_1038632 [Fomitopsis serialis]|uniref:uncharacterized protein n=1 Tax=Fomitopsis serialis TaxID=139415 RepID=UPI002007ADEA|nr:uncharacterized protein B0H18DRAFT_1038632 [Neoantrodia serialis]KAH9916332.1 hypothetical protein B0H18DRAFT_1038632 [Neoantrodia serialis]